MKYMLLIYGDETTWEALGPAEAEAVYAAHKAYGEAMAEAGVLRGGAELQPTATARTVRFAAGQARTLDGPFAETKEHLGGFYLIEVESLEEAIAWARRMPGMQGGGAVEVRPLGMTDE